MSDKDVVEQCKELSRLQDDRLRAAARLESGLRLAQKSGGEAEDVAEEAVEEVMGVINALNRDHAQDAKRLSTLECSRDKKPWRKWGGRVMWLLIGTIIATALEYVADRAKDSTAIESAGVVRDQDERDAGTFGRGDGGMMRLR